ncbi:hypothetical protein [Qipengyuania spongiae]|uniref:Uncharacterized protein n=1 Tax=Qipengyuania spongiae TaxID=2909673 RepID=A0ABY5SXF1_9SPHN|nr:hypothetical protein [Qipengyuania spongiae]UVI38840.1 hypothetical protein L1F33_11385 [Qipengyuania spongiae]
MLINKIRFVATLAVGLSASPGSTHERAFTPPALFDQPAYERPATNWRDIDDAGPQSKKCADTIRRVRAENGLPEIHNGNERSVDPLFVKAVEKRIDGCPVLVMAHDTDDLRPGPEPGDEAKFMQAD